MLVIYSAPLRSMLRCAPGNLKIYSVSVTPFVAIGRALHAPLRSGKFENVFHV